MKTLRIFLLLLAPLGFTSCLESGKFKYVKTINQTFEFNINKSGTFDDTDYIDSDQIARQLLDLNLADSYIIEEVNVSGASMKFDFRNTNTATSFDYRLNVADFQTEADFLSESGNAIPVPSSYIGQSITETIVNKYLNSKGVTLVKNFLERILPGAIGNSGGGTSNDKVYEMHLSGSVHNGGLLSAKLVLTVNIDITYTTCEKVPVGFASEACGI